MKPDVTAEAKPKTALKATSLRSVLIAGFVLLILAGGGLFYLSFSQLSSYATEVNHKIIDAQASSARIEGLQALKAQISQDESLITKADSIFATNDNYQSQAIQDVQKYAELAGVGISSTTFDEAQSEVGVRSFTVALESPTSYSGLIRFLKGIESNIPKLQVKQLAVGRSESGGDQVTVNNVQITIAVR